jgi:inner membrane protein
MHPVTHLLTGWMVANAAELSNRDRAIVTLAGVAPDIDGIGLAVEFATRGDADPILWYSNYHHVLGHNAGFAVLCFVLAFGLGRRRRVTGLLAFVAVHVHLLGDLMGSGAADGYQWPIPYLAPLSGAWQLAWSGQWALSSWQNNLITALLMAVTLYLAWRRGFSPLGMVWPQGDRVFVRTLRARFGVPRAIS